ncbi:MAG: glycosyltransferase [Lachnospiraceae bacterium]|nr:glycosyltransferase [Lachnospiraceae bacterium]
MTISVCMGTYNGEKYIGQQLYSILHQTKVPDEVIICDDGSQDGTLEKIQDFIADNHLENSWHLHQNQQNKGYPVNFYYACSLCTKEVVFLSDQDDIWCETKLERMSNVLENDLKAKAVCCKFGLIDAQGSNLQTIMAPTHNRGTGQLRNVAIEDVFYKCEWPGMVVAYRNAWFQTWFSAMPDTCTIPHDFLICARAAEEQGFLQIDEELAYHRRHDNNAGGEEHRLSKLLNKQRKLKEIEDYLRILDAFTEENVLQTQKGNAALQQKRQSMRDRYEALQSRKIGRVIANAWKHRREVRLVTLICDVVIVKK